MIPHLAILVACAAITVTAVRYLVIRGIDTLCCILRLPPKTRGQIIGYATSMPEFVVVLSAAFSGVFEAGLWNIASSNIINCVLFASGVLVYRQHRELKRKRFIDEIVFVVLSVAAPLAMFRLQLDMSLGLAAGLIAFFAVYKVADRFVNPQGEVAEVPPPAETHLGRGIAALVLGIIVVIVAGRFLGSSAAMLVDGLGVPAWAVGWILGFVTSIPELTSFFEIYRLAKVRGQLDGEDDTQEAFDALVASNMSNLGIILPLGYVVFWLVTRVVI